MKRYNQKPVVSGETRFSENPLVQLEYSKFTTTPTVFTTFNGGDIVPIFCGEVLPHDTFSCDLNYVIRQTTSINPVMGQLIIDIFAYEVQNRVVNESWKNVMGENTSGKWIAPDVSLAPLVRPYTQGDVSSIHVPVGSVADYYDFPTQQPIPKHLLEQCHDLKFRGYLSIFNNYFRDQNYQSPIPFSTLNVYNGFFEDPDETGRQLDVVIQNGAQADGTFPQGAIVEALQGQGGQMSGLNTINMRASTFSALGPPLKANKLHDYFTSVLPTPLKGREVVFNFAESAPVSLDTSMGVTTKTFSFPLKLAGMTNFQADQILGVSSANLDVKARNATSDMTSGNPQDIRRTNLFGTADLSEVSGFSLSEIRTGAAIEQIYESMARGGTRYREFISTFFGLDIDDTFNDIPKCIGHFRRDLDLFQTAQTAPGTDSNVGNLGAFGYTNKGGHLFQHTFKEHGYVHIIAVVRQKNLYSSFFPQDNFRLSMLDYYMPQLANLSEQPVYTRSINPFNADTDGVFGYQEAWAEYRFFPDRCSGYMRKGIPLSLESWTYADDFIEGLEVADGDWLQSNASQVIEKTTVLDEQTAPQFKGQFSFKITMERPMPIYSVPGMDII